MKLLRFCTQVMMVLFAASCGKKQENPLSFGVSTSSEKAFVFLGFLQPCTVPEEFGGLPDVTGNYYRVENAGFRWASETEALVLQKLTMSATLPGGYQHTCTFEGEALLTLFGLDSLMVGPATVTDTCGTGESLVSSCIERYSLTHGGCSLACGEIPSGALTSNFIVPARLELTGIALKEGESRTVSRAKRILIEYSK